MPAIDFDMQVRLEAFKCLSELVRIYGQPLPASALMRGFEFQGKRVQLKAQQGIFKPAVLPAVPLSITTAPPEPGREAPYEDGFSLDGRILVYRYRGTDPNHHQNVQLRRAILERRPLVYFHGVVMRRYRAVWPVYVVGDDPKHLSFRVTFDDAQFVGSGLLTVAESSEEARREYITVATRKRLHQESFRFRVLHAYRERCALCHLGHEQLLDAAHIIPDSEPRGLPIVPNGLALCKLHHAAFDEDLIGIRPDLVVQVREDILEEEDGPMLVHGLQGFHDRLIRVPRREQEKPRADLLEERFQKFLASPS